MGLKEVRKCIYGHHVYYPVGEANAEGSEVKGRRQREREDRQMEWGWVHGDRMCEGVFGILFS